MSPGLPERAPDESPTTAGPLTSLERVTIALLMTWTAGFVDIVGYVSLYGLYVSHMSGNTVAMAHHIAQIDWIGIRAAWLANRDVHFRLDAGSVHLRCGKAPQH